MSATERIDLRTTPRVKTAIQKAAERVGLSVSAFIAQNAYQAAQEILSMDNFVLNDRERDLFLSALDNPPKPNAALKALFKNKP
jgi:uncharacterized protein (DUF1778 family)